MVHTTVDQAEERSRRRRHRVSGRLAALLAALALALPAPALASASTPTATPTTPSAHVTPATAQTESSVSAGYSMARQWASVVCPPGFEMLPGCATPPASSASGTWTTSTIAGMSVRLYVPESAPALEEGRALMIGLHGCVQSASVLQQAGNWQATADAYGMVVALPDAPNGGVLLGC